MCSACAISGFSAEDGRHPFQSIDDRGAVGAEPQHLAEPLIEIAEGQIAARGFAHDPNRHRGTDDAGHRTDRAVMMAGFEWNRTALRQHTRLLDVLGPAFEQDRPDDRALHGAAHTLPRDRRTRMKKKAAAHPWDCVACETDPGQNRLRRKIGLEGLAVRRLDLGMVNKTSQGGAGGAISLCRRRPFYLLDGAA